MIVITPRCLPARESLQPLPSVRQPAGQGQPAVVGGDQTQPVHGGFAQGAQTWARNLDVPTDWLHLPVWLQVQQGGTHHVHTARLETPPHSRLGARNSSFLYQGSNQAARQNQFANTRRFRFDKIFIYTI